MNKRLLPFLRKFKSVFRPARLTLFLRDKFLVRRQLKRFRKNRNCSFAEESIHLAAVTLTADGSVNNIKFASYLTGNRPLTCKCITKRQRPSNTRTVFVWDFPHFVNACEIYFFIYLSTREKCLSRGFYLLSVSREDWIPVGVFS